MKAPEKKRIAIIGGGPAGLFMFKRLVESGNIHITVDIFESGSSIGNGMPYSEKGAATEHITNVSGNEIPGLVTPMVEWVKSLPDATLQAFNINRDKFNEYNVFPRLLFGDYLHQQFLLLIKKAATMGIQHQVHTNSFVEDIVDDPAADLIHVKLKSGPEYSFDAVVVCTGHYWPVTKEGKVAGWFDSPYPPLKLAGRFNHPVALKGSSLTAIDAIRTLARYNGRFIDEDSHQPVFVVDKASPDFKIVMYSINGLLPGVRFHLADPQLSIKSFLSKEEITRHRRENDGFVSLDFIFEKDFKASLLKKDPAFYEQFKDLGMEEFVQQMMQLRESINPFNLLQLEYEEASQSMQQKKSVYWKELLAMLSFALNYPAKYFSAEDRQRHQEVLMPLISIIIAFVPQNSCEELMALYNAGILEVVPVDKSSRVDVDTNKAITYYHTDTKQQLHASVYKTFIDATGQKHLWLKDFPFKSLVSCGTVSQALLRFRSAEAALNYQLAGNKNIEKGKDNHYYLQVPGLNINDCFSAIDTRGEANPRLYIMAVPYLGGYNPDYSGLDFCDESSSAIAGDILG